MLSSRPVTVAEKGVFLAVARTRSRAATVPNEDEVETCASSVA